MGINFNRLFLLLGLILTVSISCSYPQQQELVSIENDYRDFVDYSDGICEKEAVVLAKRFVFKKGIHQRLHSLIPVDLIELNEYFLDGKRVYFAQDPQINIAYDHDKSWVVLFREKTGSLFNGNYPVIPLYIKVDGDSGSILEWGLWDDEVQQQYLG